MFDRLKALQILSECTGDDIWSLPHCRRRSVPEAWLDELADSFESGFRDDSQTIYVGEEVVNQYHGVRDVDLAIKAVEYLGLDAAPYIASALNRRHLVRTLREAVEEGD